MNFKHNIILCISILYSAIGFSMDITGALVIAYTNGLNRASEKNNPTEKCDNNGEKIQKILFSSVKKQDELVKKIKDAQYNNCI